MKTVLKIVIAAALGLITAWLCYQVFHLDQVMATVATLIAALAAYTICDKVMDKK